MSSADGLRKLLAEMGIAPEGAPALRLIDYLRHLEKWNRRMNLTASTEWRALEPLFRESLWAAGIYPDSRRRHLDVGSGAGFPAVPLRILRPRMRLELVESRWKRAVFLEAVVRDLGLDEVRVHGERLEQFLLGTGTGASWDCVSWKGVRLNRREVCILFDRTVPLGEFWVFHGRGFPVEDPEGIAVSFRLLRREKAPSRKGSFLSIYQKSDTLGEDVSRETRF